MRRMLLATLTVAAFGLGLGTDWRVLAQAPAANDPASLTFEVASVKANKSGDNRTMIGGQPGGRFNVTNAALRQIIQIAYQIQPFQLIGAPNWINDERFDIVAKAPAGTPMVGPAGGTSPGPMQFMLRNLLTDRFKLKTHTETREMPMYALVVARSDGKLGPKMKKADVDCAALRGRGPGGPPAPPAPGERPQCGMMMGIGSVAAGGVSMTQLSQLLSQRVGRTVVDKTGLSGFYEFNLDFTPDQIPGAGGPGPVLPPGAPALPPVDPNGPSIYTALQEQLGLKLDAQRGQVEVTVVDSVDHPTED